MAVVGAEGAGQAGDIERRGVLEETQSSTIGTVGAYLIHTVPQYARVVPYASAHQRFLQLPIRVPPVALCLELLCPLELLLQGQVEERSSSALGVEALGSRGLCGSCYATAAHLILRSRAEKAAELLPNRSAGALPRPPGFPPAQWRSILLVLAVSCQLPLLLLHQQLQPKAPLAVPPPPLPPLPPPPPARQPLPPLQPPVPSLPP